MLSLPELQCKRLLCVVRYSGIVFFCVAIDVTGFVSESVMIGMGDINIKDEYK